MVRYLFIFIFFQSLIVFAQESPIVQKGLLQIQPTVSPGYLFLEDETTVYFRANMEYFINNRISLRTDAYVYFGSQSDTNLLSKNHSAFLGVSYHFTKKNTDVFLGFQPGIAFSETNPLLTGINDDIRVSPLLSLSIGVNQYLNRFLHFFLNTQYVHGKHVPVYTEVVSLNEFRFTMGLGFNLNLLHKNVIPHKGDGIK